jgi:hypothetical protein
VTALITALGGAAARCTNSSGADIALAGASAGTGVTALTLDEPPFFAGRSFTTHLTVLRWLLAECTWWPRGCCATAPPVRRRPAVDPLGGCPPDPEGS